MEKSSELFDTVLNLSKYHREHEKYSSQTPLQEASRVLKTYADHWSEAKPQKPKTGSPYLGCEDLNETATIQSTGVLFMEGEGEPAEIARLKRNLATMAGDFGETGRWLSEAMQASWEAAKPLLQHPAIAEVLGERHRIIANDWQAANLSILISQMLQRVLDLSPAAVRVDLAGARTASKYLYSASEILDRAADLASESATLVHDNDRRWRVFRQRIQQVAQAQPGGNVPTAET